MATLPAQDLSVDLRAVTVRPTWGAREHRRWDRLVAEHHYLPFHGVIGKGLRHVAVHGETWLALIGWQPGAFKLAARDRWIGWPAEQQFRRLHLIANNSRFVILTPGRVHNLYQGALIKTHGDGFPRFSARSARRGDAGHREPCATLPESLGKPPSRSPIQSVGGRRNGLTMPRIAYAAPPTRRTVWAISMGLYQRSLVLASRVLGLSLRRLSQDIQAVHGYPVFLAETFVDVSRFVGTCYRASNWRSLGLTRGFAREPGGAARWRHHGQPKEIFVFELTDAAAEALSRTEVPAHWNAEQHTEPMAAPRLRSLFECLGEVPECRRDRGKRYPLNTVLAIAVAARLAGYRGVNAFAQFAALLSQEQLEAVGAFWSPSKQRYTAPAITTFHNILAALPPETLDNAIGQWTGQHSTAHAPVAMDGKDLRGASKQTEDGRRMMVAAVEHDSGMVLGQVEVDSKSNEIPAVRELSSSLDLAGRIVTVDAMHAQHETARCLLGRRADYVISAIKDNQETILEDLKAIDFSDAPWHETVDKGHGRIERRRCAAVDLSGAEWDGYANLHGRRQAMRIEREREILKTGKSSIEVTWSLTSLGTDRAGPEELLALVRNHWHIENRLHYVRDFTYDEDRCRAYVRHLPRNLACLTNVAIAIVRCSGRFRYLPEANRHYAARAQDALDAILIAPTA